jgi:hypothetical protein
MEARGIIVTAPPPDPDSATVDAFSSSCLPRPVVVLTSNRSDDVYRYRFTASHELGHLVLHADTAAGDIQQEREADAFAAEFLTPRASIMPLLPARADLGRLAELQRIWGVSVSSLLYRCREVGLLSDSAASRAYARLNELSGQPGFASEPVSGFPGEQPALLKQAFELASAQAGLTVPALARELAWTTGRVRELLGEPDQRPELRLVLLAAKTSPGRCPGEVRSGRQSLRCRWGLGPGAVDCVRRFLGGAGFLPSDAARGGSRVHELLAASAGGYAAAAHGACLNEALEPVVHVLRGYA